MSATHPVHAERLRAVRRRRFAVTTALGMSALLIGALLPAPAAAQYSMTAPSGLVIEFDGDRLLEMRDRSVELWDILQEDPLVAYYTAYGIELTGDSGEGLPWNAIDVVTDSLAAVITPGNLREADRAYYNYAVLRMKAVRADPDVPCGELQARELEAVDGFIDGWIIARTLFGGPAVEQLDEFVFAREAGVLAGMIADRSDRQLGGCLAVWRETHLEDVEAYRTWHTDRYTGN